MISNTAGNATRAKRKAPSNMGGRPSRPTLITTKLTPQAMITTSANSKSFNGIVPTRSL
ncbi:hypothetical protein D3C80_1885810 [compost metagenome]